MATTRMGFTMRARTLSFYIDPSQLIDVMRVVDEEIVPAYRSMPHFVGLVILRSERTPRQVIGMSFWDGDLEESEELIEGFRQRLREVADTSLATEPHEVLRLVCL